MSDDGDDFEIEAGPAIAPDPTGHVPVTPLVTGPFSPPATPVAAPVAPVAAQVEAPSTPKARAPVVTTARPRRHETKPQTGDATAPSTPKAVSKAQKKRDRKAMNFAPKEVDHPEPVVETKSEAAAEQPPKWDSEQEWARTIGAYPVGKPGYVPEVLGIVYPYPEIVEILVQAKRQRAVEVIVCAPARGDVLSGAFLAGWDTRKCVITETELKCHWRLSVQEWSLRKEQQHTALGRKGFG